MDNYYIEKEKQKMAQFGIEHFDVEVKGKMQVSVPHMHPYIEILFCAEGKISVNLDGKEYIVSANEVILLRSNTVHSIYSLEDGKNSYHVLKVKLSFILDFTSKESQALYLSSLISKDKKGKVVWKMGESENLFKQLKRLNEEESTMSYGSDIAIKICVMYILLTILRDTPYKNSTVSENDDLARRIYDVALYIDRHYAEDISAKELCVRATLSYNYFSNVFKNITGFSFKDYLINARLSHAEQELLATDKSITDIALSCGFNSTSYFITAFKKSKGITPSELRKNVKHGKDFQPVS